MDPLTAATGPCGSDQDRTGWTGRVDRARPAAVAPALERGAPMHEMSIAAAVVEQVADAAVRHGATAVATVRLEVGELAGVVPEALAFCFALACAGTVLEGAALETLGVAALARCGPCAVEWRPGMPPDLLCPRCGGPDAVLLTGRELRVREVEWAGTVPSAPAPPS